MQPSILASATAELPAAAGGAAPREDGGVLAVILRSPAGLTGVALCGLVLLAGLAGPFLAPLDPYVVTGPSLGAPSSAHWMGTDALGRDLFSGILHGARASLAVGVAVGLIAFVLGCALGLVAGFHGGRMDDALMRFTEFFQVLPRFFLAIIAIALLGPGLDRIIIVLGVTSWPVLARVVRAEVLSLRSLEYVRAAEAAGATPMRIMRDELLPNVLPQALVVVGLLIAQTLLLEAGLGFIGLGDPNALSWGSLAGQAQSYLRAAWWLPFFPGVAITAAVLGVNLLGDALSAALGGRT